MPLDDRRVGHIDLVDTRPTRPLQHLRQTTQTAGRPHDLPINPHPPALVLDGRINDHGTLGHAHSLTRTPHSAHLETHPLGYQGPDRIRPW